MTRRVLKAGDCFDYMEWQEQGDNFLRKTFGSAQQCQDWLEEFRPGEVVEWRVIGDRF